MSTAAIGTLVFTIIEAPEVGWAGGRSLAGFAAAAAVAAFVGWERRVDQPMLDVRLFRNLRFTAASGSVTVAFFALFGFIFMVTQYFQFLKAYSPFGTGIRLLPVAGSVAVASIVGTKLAVRVGNKVVVSVGLGSIAIAFLWISTASVATPYLEIVGQMILLGTGLGLTSAPATEAIMGVVPKEKAGIGSAMNDATARVRRHPRRRRHRQHLRVALREPAGPPRPTARRSRHCRQRVGRRRVHRRSARRRRRIRTPRGAAQDRRGRQRSSTASPPAVSLPRESPRSARSSPPCSFPPSRSPRPTTHWRQ